MKKILSIILLLCLCCAFFAGCGDSGKETAVTGAETEEKTIDGTGTETVEESEETEQLPMFDLNTLDIGYYIGVEDEYNTLFIIDTDDDGITFSLSLFREFALENVFADKAPGCLTFSCNDESITGKITFEDDTVSVEILTSPTEALKPGIYNFNNFMNEVEYAEFNIKRSLMIDKDGVWVYETDAFTVSLKFGSDGNYHYVKTEGEVMKEVNGTYEIKYGLLYLGDNPYSVVPEDSAEGSININAVGEYEFDIEGVYNYKDGAADISK